MNRDIEIECQHCDEVIYYPIEWIKKSWSPICGNCYGVTKARRFMIVGLFKDDYLEYCRISYPHPRVKVLQ